MKDIILLFTYFFNFFNSFFLNTEFWHIHTTFSFVTFPLTFSFYFSIPFYYISLFFSFVLISRLNYLSVSVRTNLYSSIYSNSNAESLAIWWGNYNQNALRKKKTISLLIKNGDFSHIHITYILPHGFINISKLIIV